MLRLSGMTVASAALPVPAQQLAPADYTLDIAAYELEAGPRRKIKTIAYTGQVPGPLLRLKEGRPVTIDVTNQVDKYLGRWYLAFDPALERTLHGPDVNQG